MMEESTPERVVLVIENNSDQASLMASILSESSVPCRIVSISEGQQAMNFLQGKSPELGTSRPDLILLDLDLPGKSGTEILAEIKANPQLRQIPIVVLTLSTNQIDVYQTYALQGNCYVIKSCDRNQLIQIIQQIEKFWLEIVTLPVK